MGVFFFLQVVDKEKSSGGDAAVGGGKLAGEKRKADDGEPNKDLKKVKSINQLSYYKIFIAK